MLGVEHHLYLLIAADRPWFSDAKGVLKPAKIQAHDDDS